MGFEAGWKNFIRGIGKEADPGEYKIADRGGAFVIDAAAYACIWCA